MVRCSPCCPREKQSGKGRHLRSERADATGVSIKFRGFSNGEEETAERTSFRAGHSPVCPCKIAKFTFAKQNTKSEHFLAHGARVGSLGDGGRRALCESSDRHFLLPGKKFSRERVAVTTTTAMKSGNKKSARDNEVTQFGFIPSTSLSLTQRVPGGQVPDGARTYRRAATGIILN